MQVHRIGICGTDISGYLGKMPFFSDPRIPGHELGVEVLEVGAGVGNIKPGDRCSVEPYMICQQCLACRRRAETPTAARTLQVLGVHTDGGMRPRIIVPARKLHPSSKLTLEQLALVETLGIGCHAVDRGAARRRASTPSSISAEPIEAPSAIEFLKVAGSRITVLDLNEKRLAFCKETMGVENIVRVDADGADLKQIERITEGNLPTLVIDATGNAGSMCNAFNCVGFTGRLVFVGITSRPGFAFPIRCCIAAR